MVLLGHTHTHEFALGGTTDQVGNPWALDRSAGGSSGGSAAALAARMAPAATGSDTAGSLRIPSALCGTSTIKPTRGLLPLRGVVPLSIALDHAGPMARTVEDCALLLAGMGGPGAAKASLAGARLGVSPRVGDLDPDVAAGFDAALVACRRAGATLVEVPPLPDRADEYYAVLAADVLAWHRRFDARRELYRPAIREFVELAEEQTLSAEGYVRAQLLRADDAERLEGWLAAERVAALLEPTVPVVAEARGHGYDRARSDLDLISLTYHWNWTGHPVVALPSGLGARSGLPTSVSLIGPLGAEAQLLGLGIELQARLGVPAL